jgi:hypothetical protein
MVRKLLTRGLPGAALTIPLAVHCFAQAQTNRGTVELSVQRQIMDLERQGLEAAKKRDSSAVQRLLTADALDVGEYGIWDAKKSAESIASLEKHPGSELAEYSVSGWKFRRAAENVVVVAYKVILITMSNNVRQSPTIQYYSAVWVRQDNTWRILLYHNSTVPAATTSGQRSKD